MSGGSQDTADIHGIVAELLAMLDHPRSEHLRDTRQPGPDEHAQFVARNLPDDHVGLDPADENSLALGLRARTDEAHLAEEDVPELRQLIESGPAQKPADRRHPRIIVPRLPLDVLWIDDHRPELQHSKRRATEPDAQLSEHDWAAVLEQDRDRDTGPERCGHRQRGSRDDYVERPLEDRLRRKRTHAAG